MDQDELLRRVVGSLEAVGLRYLVTGSIATSLYGEPRFTNDIDVVVDLPLDRLEELLRQFPTDEFYLSEESARRAVERRTQFNVIHPRSGLKVDVMVAADDAFDESRFARGRRLHPAPDYRATFAAPEDVIVKKKMEYYRAGGSDRHLRDIAGVLNLARCRARTSGGPPAVALWIGGGGWSGEVRLLGRARDKLSRDAGGGH